MPNAVLCSRTSQTLTAMRPSSPSFGQHIVLRQEAVGARRDGAVARPIRAEIGRPVLGEEHLSSLAMRPQELSGMIAAAMVTVSRPRSWKRSTAAAVPVSTRIPCVAVDGLVAHGRLTDGGGWGNEGFLEGPTADFHVASPR